MNIEQITALVAQGESEMREFKETTGTRREAAMTVCAGSVRSEGALG